MIKPPKYYARILSPTGVYPLESAFFTDAAYYADDDLCFSIHEFSTNTRGRDGESESYSEVQWLNPSEVRLYGALTMSIVINEQFLSFYPHGTVERINDSNNKISDHDWLKNKVKSFLLNKISAPDHHEHGYTTPQRNPYQDSKVILPPAFSNQKYSFRKDINFELAKKIFNNVKLNDDLYLRGIHTLIKGGMLSRHYEFLEEAIYNLFISMDVAFCLVRRKLIDNGKPNPTSIDAMTYILKAFNEHHRIVGEGIEKWFEEYYDRRIMSFHPDSKFGIVPHAPLYADDFFHLYTDMIEVYRYLICGYVEPNDL